MVNKVILVGNLGSDPDTKTAAGGLAVCRLSVATSTRVKKGESWEDETEWNRVVCFGKTAENAARYLAKGRQVYIEGRLKTNKWQDKEGKDRYTTEILANEVRFLGGGKGEERAPARSAEPAQSYGGSAPASREPGQDDDIPF